LALTRTQLEPSLEPISRAKAMPSRFYTDPQIFTLECQHIFRTSWFFLCREDQLAKAGDYRTFDSCGGPLLVITGHDQTRRCFANFCRHRGSILLEGEGSASHIVCPYHAWSYRTDGQLYGCPDMKDAEGFDRIEYGLIPVRMESWNGFLFATFDPAASPLKDYLGDMPERFASHRLEDMRAAWRIVFETRCNWKLILENAMETYHTGVVHKDSVGAQQSRTLPTRGNWLCIQVISGRSIATLPGTLPPFPAISGLDDDARQGTYFTVVHPCCQFAVAQDCMWWLNVLPLAHDRSRLEIGGCFPRDALDDPDFAAKAAPYYERWEKVGREDISILEKQQLALASFLYRPGPLSWRDDMVQAIGRWVVDRLPL
jgi:choline monooxygenase